MKPEKIFLLLAGLLVIAGCQSRDVNLKGVQIDPALACQTDSDCILVAKTDPQEPCCSLCEVQAVNSAEKAKRDSWQAANCGNLGINGCPVYDCYSADKQPYCFSGVCQIKTIE